jgi:predicted metal-dependent enzyme (double-stranded beta helix superfamily)
VTMPPLPGRYLDKYELGDLAAELANRPGMWHDQEAWPEGKRHYAMIHRDEFVDAWLICWAAGTDTGWHDHDSSSGAVRVVRGVIKEANPSIGGQHVERLIGQGGSVFFGPEHIHRMTGEAERSVSIHVYSPPLARMGQYTIDDNGILRRLPVSYAEELRPLAAGQVA